MPKINNLTITLANNPLPHKRKATRKPTYNTKWSKIFKAVQDTGKRQELISSDGLWTHGQMANVKQSAQSWSNRNGFGKIKIQTRSVRVADSGPRHEQYQFRVWATVPTKKVEPTPDESTESTPDDIVRLIDQILSL